MLTLLLCLLAAASSASDPPSKPVLRFEDAAELIAQRYGDGRLIQFSGPDEQGIFTCHWLGTRGHVSVIRIDGKGWQILRENNVLDAASGH